MNAKTRVMFVSVILIAAVARARADFDPYETSRNAVMNYALEGQAATARLLCAADLVHWGGFGPGFIQELPDVKTRSTFENVCTLLYAGKRAVAVSIAYSMLSTPAAKLMPKLAEAVEAILDTRPKD